MLLYTRISKKSTYILKIWGSTNKDSANKH